MPVPVSSLSLRFAINTEKLVTYYLNKGIKNVVIDEEIATNTLSAILTLEGIKNSGVKAISVNNNSLVYELYFNWGNSKPTDFKNDIVAFQKAIDNLDQPPLAS